MSRIGSLIVALAASAVGPLAWAQPGGPPGGPGFPPSDFRPMLPLQRALDSDGDGKLSAAEIDDAPKALAKLDRGGDGKLDAEEIGWPPRWPAFGPGRPGPGGRDGFAPGRSLAQRILARDANGDGKVAAGELPSSMGWLLRRFDVDGDGALDRQEAERIESQGVKAPVDPKRAPAKAPPAAQETQPDRKAPRDPRSASQE